MTAERDMSRVVRSWLREDEHESAERVLLTVLSRLDATPQRRPWWPSWRAPRMNIFTKLAIGAATVIVAVLVGSQLLPGGVIGPGGKPTPTPLVTPPSTLPPAATSSPVPSGPAALPYASAPAAGLLQPGPLVLDGAFPLTITFDVPAGWSREGSAESAELASVHKVRGASSPAWASFALASNVFADACHGTAGPLDPPVGPSVAELVTALTNVAGFDATEPTDVTIDGHSGRQFALSSAIDPASAGCDDPPWLDVWRLPSGNDARVPAPATLQFWVLDVDGTRLVMFTEEYGATLEDAAEARSILESARFR